MGALFKAVFNAVLKSEFGILIDSGVKVVLLMPPLISWIDIYNLFRSASYV